jgi:hypothetical protein
MYRRHWHPVGLAGGLRVSPTLSASVTFQTYIRLALVRASMASRALVTKRIYVVTA